LRDLASDGRVGLTSAEARRRLARYGHNALAERPPPSFLRMALGQLASVVTLALVGAAAVTAMLGHMRDGVVILGILAVNAVLGALQDFHADRSLRALRSLSAPRARVLRDGEVRELPAADLVPGDIVLLREGDGIPADVRLVRCRSLEVDEALLTGESLPVRKSDATVELTRPLAERTGVAYMGSSVVGGRAKALVVATGMATEMGRITGLLEQPDEVQSPLQRRMGQLVKQLLAGSLLLGAVVGAIGIVRGQTPLSMLMTGISMAIAAVPEGLPVFVTVAQAAAVRRMARRQMLVRRLSALETLARVSIVCCDKTGTLTANEMHVRAITDGATSWRVQPSPAGYAFFEGDQRIAPLSQPPLVHLLTLGVLGTSSRLLDGNGHGNGSRNGDTGRLIQGSRTGAAFLLAADAAGLDLSLVRERYEKVAEAPFDTARRDNRLLYQDPGGGYLLIVKGAPEAVLPRCVARITPEGESALNDPERAAIVSQADAMARDALRVLAIGCVRLDGPLTDLELEAADVAVSFAGLVGLMDPPRSDVSDAIAQLRRAGIRVAMITGDHPETARAIAAELGLSPSHAEALTGPQIDAMSDAALAEAVREIHLFARVTPEHKLRIVAALQGARERVAMTGDGVNDAPAVRLADVGISMGRRGAEVTRQAAALVITDDRFPTILGALAEGRAIQRDLRRGLGFLLGGNTGETLFVAAAIAAGLPMPLLPGQILLLNLLSDALPILALVAQPPTRQILDRSIDATREPVVAPDLFREVGIRGAATGAAALGAFAYALRSGNLALARSVGFATIVGGQLFQIAAEGLFGREAAAGEGRAILGSALLVSAAALAASLHLPWFQQMFALVSPGRAGWGAALAASATASAGLLVLRGASSRPQLPVGDQRRSQGEPDPPRRLTEPYPGHNPALTSGSYT
jgi:Ca2+-transporting ATPase